MTAPPALRRVAMVSVHTSPFEQPGRANAGGLNVYVRHLAEELASTGLAVDVFTRRGAELLEPVRQLAPGLRLLAVTGRFDTMGKDDLAYGVDEFAAAVLDHPDRSSFYDVLHGHYWLAGLVGERLRADLGAPLVQSMHTLAAVKDALRPPGQPPEPAVRSDGERRVARAADRLIASTAHEAEILSTAYGAAPERIVVVPPGADLARFSTGDVAPARARLAIESSAQLVVFAGRLEPGKGLGVLLDALDQLPTRRRPLLAVIGDYTPGASGRTELESRLAACSAAGSAVLVPPQPQRDLAVWFRAADIVTVPSYSESFGLVALEAQGCGTPVVATRVGGLETAVADGVSGLLVDGHDPGTWASAIARLLDDDALRDRLAGAAPAQAARFRWERTAAAVVEIYSDAIRASRRPCRACA